MPRKLKVAAVQMDATPAPVANRLNRAADLIAEAASAGAQLVVLPEVFNTGYEYTEANYPLAESLEGTTVTWMKNQAAQHHLHLAGTLMLLDGSEVYNAALLVAPDGRLWRYDKHYPFLWERAYFREGHAITVADTDLGKLGMLICWDSAHPQLWEKYAGKVDAMLVMSCPPKISSADLVFDDGTRLSPKELGPLWASIYTEEEHFPGQDMDEHAAWMGVPIIHTVAGGQFRTPLPLPTLSASAYVAGRPDLWGKLLDADSARLEAGYDKQTKIVDAGGQVVARLTKAGDGFTLAEIELADELPHPHRPQPAMRTTSLAYLLADVIGTAMVTPLYRRGLRQQWGAQMAPVASSTKVWGAIAIIALILGWLLGRVGKRRRSS